MYANLRLTVLTCHPLFPPNILVQKLCPESFRFCVNHRTKYFLLCAGLSRAVFTHSLWTAEAGYAPPFLPAHSFINSYLIQQVRDVEA